MAWRHNIRKHFVHRYQNIAHRHPHTRAHTHRCCQWWTLADVDDWCLLSKKYFHPKTGGQYWGKADWLPLLTNRFECGFHFVKIYDPQFMRWRQFCHLPPIITIRFLSSCSRVLCSPPLAKSVFSFSLNIKKRIIGWRAGIMKISTENIHTINDNQNSTKQFCTHTHTRTL